MKMIEFEILGTSYELPEEAFNWLTERGCFTPYFNRYKLNPVHLFTAEEVEVLLSQELPDIVNGEDTFNESLVEKD